MQDGIKRHRDALPLVSNPQHKLEQVHRDKNTKNNQRQPINHVTSSERITDVLPDGIEYSHNRNALINL
jgi:hypothetical protein